MKPFFWSKLWIALIWGGLFGEIQGLQAQRDESDTLNIIARNINNPYSAEAVEGCVDGIFTFFKTGNSFFEQTFTITLSGTATNGIDYEQVNVAQVVIPAGRDSVNLRIIPVLDSLEEGTETIRLISNSLGINDTVELLVKDLPVLNLNIDTTICEGEPFMLDHTRIPDAINYRWRPGTGLSDSTVAAPLLQVEVAQDQRLTIFLTETDKNLCQATDAANIFIKNKPLSAFSGPTNLCAGTSGQFNYIGTAGPDDTFQWDFGDNATVTGDVDGPGPLNVHWDEAGVKEVCLTVTDSICTHETFCSSVNVGIAPEVKINPVGDQCFDGHNLSFSPLDSVSVDTYRWNLGSDASSSSSDDMTLENIIYSRPGIKTVSLIISKDGCTRGDQISFELAETPSANFELLGDTFCKDACVRPIYQGEILGNAQRFEWNFGANGIPAQSILKDPLCTSYEIAGDQTVKLTVTYKGCVATDSQSINILDLPIASVDAGRDTSFCEGEEGIRLNANIEGGSGNDTFTWFSNLPDESSWGIDNRQSQNPLVNPVVSELPQRVTYYLLTTTENGCLSNIDSIKVRVNPKPRVDAGPDLFICENGPGKLLLGKPASDNLAPGPFLYKWSPNISISDTTVANPLVFPKENTTYYLRATSINGCSSEFDPSDTLTAVDIRIQPLPTALAGTDTSICLGDTVQLSGIAEGGRNTFQYRWTPTETGYIDDSTIANPIVSPEIATVYSLVVIENGCASKASNTTITVKPIPTVTTPSEQSICLGDTIRLEALAFSEATEISPFTYQWTPSKNLSTPSSQRPLASPDTTTTYSFRAFSNAGCPSATAQTTVIVKPSPIAAIQRDTSIICIGDTLVMNASASFSTTPSSTPLTFEWSPRDSIFVRDRFSNSISVSPASNQWFTLTTSISGDCPDSDSLLVKVLPRPQVNLASNNLQICEGENIQLALNGDTTDLSYQWLPDSNITSSRTAQPLVSPKQSTIYQLLVTRSGCTDTLSARIHVIPTPNSDFLYSDTSGCADLTVAFLENTTNAEAFIWDFGDGSPVSNLTNPVHTYDTPGTYAASLTALGPDGCSSTSNPVAIRVTPPVVAAFQTDVLKTDTLQIPEATIQFTDQSLNATEWLWAFGDGNYSTEASPAHDYWKPGTYDITLTANDEFGCSDQFTLGSFVVLNPELFIPNVFSPNNDGINDVYRIIYTGLEPHELIIFDRWGKEIYQANTVEKVWNGRLLNGNQAPEGVYFYVFKAGEKYYKGELTLVR